MKLSKALLLFSQYSRQVILLAALCVAVQVHAASGPSVTDLYKTAATQYKAGQFAEAAASYESIVKQGYKTPEVYYNLGNCYYKTDNTGKAILNYERAQRLAPDDEDIAHNLKLANLKVADKIVPVPQLSFITWCSNFMCSQSAKGWGIYAVVCVWLAFFAFAAYLFVGTKKVTATIGTLFIIFSIAFVSLAFRQENREIDSPEAILTVPSTYVKSAPDANGTDVFMIHEGLKFSILDKVGTWNKIRLADGKVGWVERNHFEKI